MPSFKQYREADGKFYFKLNDSQGNLLLQSLGFESPKDAGQAIRQLQSTGPQALASLAAQVNFADGVGVAEVGAALQQLTDAN